MTSPPVPFARSTFNETQPALSPNGRWMAYVSDELAINQQRDVYIQAFPGGGKKIQVSETTRGGQQPRWSRDGCELFYVAPDKRIIAIPVESAGDALRLGPARPLFQTMIGAETGLGTRASYDVTRDGKKFIVAEAPADNAAAIPPFTLLVNWRAARRLVWRQMMSLAPGTKLGPYEIVAPIGEGGDIAASGLVGSIRSG